jgi:glycosyltransferase involved in cell wall biosynthesis
MRIYVVYGGNLYPQRGMSQVRVYNQLVGLGSDHEVIFSDVITNGSSLDEAKRRLATLRIDYRPIMTSRVNKNRIQRFWGYLARYIKYHLTTVTKEELSLASKGILGDIIDIVKKTQADAVLVHYWYLGNLFSLLDPRVLRMIDTHYVVEENIELQNTYSLSSYRRWKLKKELEYSLKMQRKYFLASDLVIVNSPKQKKMIHAWNPGIPVSVTVNGQDLDPYLTYLADVNEEKTIGFYGSLSNQFNRKALQRILTQIYPGIKHKIPEAKLLVIGANPPMDLLDRIKDDSISITGYVDDIRPYLTKCRVILLPIETGSGFRGRAVEIMALGIPVVGTSNSLQSVGLINGEQGFIEETDDGMVGKTIALLSDVKLWDRISQNSRRFARDNFSIAATFGALSKELMNITGPQRQVGN